MVKDFRKARRNDRILGVDPTALHVGLSLESKGHGAMLSC
jgi:hypothetical protein